MERVIIGQQFLTPKQACPFSGRPFYAMMFRPESNQLVPIYKKEESTEPDAVPVRTAYSAVIVSGDEYFIIPYDLLHEEWQEPIPLHKEQLLIEIIKEVVPAFSELANAQPSRKEETYLLLQRLKDVENYYLR